MIDDVEPLEPDPSPWDLDEQAMAAEDRYLRLLGADR